MSELVDPAMPWMADALDHAMAEAMLQTSVTLPGIDSSSLRLRDAKLSRHRQGRRSIIEYTLDARSRGGRRRLQLVGKIRAKSLDRATVRVLSELRDAGFHPDSEDHISVPELAGVIPEWHMWLAVRVPGLSLSDHLAGTDREKFAERASDVARKIHDSGVTATAKHFMRDEIAILNDALSKASEVKPNLAQRIRDVMLACHEIARQSGPGRISGIHRDFYADQIVVSGDNLVVLDLDQFCEGDISLDVGNFMAHITELSLRLSGNPSTFDDARCALLARAVSNGGARETILVYDLLSLARHIWISMRIENRNHITEQILAECERRLEQSSVEIS
ncbi:MAG TPA: phosphotransferase [Gemmatimonadaceae bacterium]|nr:phosphotransferase [Gemmatimonadaceae bacterium]